jgi:23S rRNA pseudouridine1911/1915/1917 synthase
LRFSQYNSQKYLSLIEAKLLTGKRHQIRAHCGYLGFPLLGDTLYGSKYVIEEEELTNRPAFFLHSQKLEFYHPKTRENLAFEAILPDYFLHYFEINN